MSRMQSILEKAERDGAVMRLRAPAPTVAPAVVAADPSVPPIDTFEAPPELAAPATPARTASALRLDPALVAAGPPDTAAAREYVGLCTRIVYADPAASANVVLVASPGTGEGKSITAANLGLTMAREYQRSVCIVDANLRSPRLAQLFGLPEAPGLAEVLAGRVPLEEALTTIENVRVTVLPAGARSGHPVELLGSPAMRQTLDRLRSQFDRIIVDTPAALPVVDIGLLTPLVDRIVLVVRAGVTPKSAVQDVMATIDATRLLGVILNEAA